MAEIVTASKPRAIICDTQACRSRCGVIVVTFSCSQKVRKLAPKVSGGMTAPLASAAM